MEVVQDLIFIQFQVAQAVVAHVLGTMARQAVVYKSLRAPLQGRFIRRTDGRMVKLDVVTAREYRERSQAKYKQETCYFFHYFTLVGSGLHLSILLYHGMRMKNAK